MARSIDPKSKPRASDVEHDQKSAFTEAYKQRSTKPILMFN